MSNRVVIVGGGLAAARAVRAYRDAGGAEPVTMLSADSALPYNRPPLSKGFLRGEIETDAVFVEPAAAYADLDVAVEIDTTVAGVDTERRTVALAGGSELGYGRLVLATGALPRTLGIPGEDLDGVHSYRTLADATAVREAAKTAGSAVVVGAGFIGMETAASLRTRGLEVTLVEPADSLFASLQAPAVSGFLERLYRDRGVEVLLGESIDRFDGAGDRLERAVTRSGRAIAADLAIVGVGVGPSTGYLEGSGVALERGAVLVNERFETSVAGVYAAGDVASFHDPVFGHRRLIQHWTNANHHGERLGRILAGEDAPYDLVAYFFSEVFGTKLGLLGDLDAGHDRLVVRGSLEDGGVIGFFLSGERLVAALVSGQTPETQSTLTGLLRDHAVTVDAAALEQPESPLEELFRTPARPHV
jgi:NTE family protein